ncbi:MAG TPA: peptide chain release factor N(5)-glutamine methyltransferase [Longimicrobium sp.]|jgi:release factor glutamine methyltransferase
MELLRWTAEYLGEKGFHNARLNGELLLSGVLGVKRLDLYLQFDRPLRPEELAEFKSRLLRRAKREPLQYIEGEAHFRELRLRVDPRVLIPRPETEQLVQHVLDWAAARPGLAAADVGTGSGAIALALAKEGTFDRVVATDVEPGALEAARANHAHAAPAAPVEFRLGPGVAPLRGERFDVLVSNPPYIGTGERESLDVEVRDWEPASALFAGADGLDVIRELVAGAPAVLRPGGLLALEIGEGQGAAVAGLVGACGAFGPARVEKDLAGRDRIVLAELETSTD